MSKILDDLNDLKKLHQSNLDDIERERIRIRNEREDAYKQMRVNAELEAEKIIERFSEIVKPQLLKKEKPILYHAVHDIPSSMICLHKLEKLLGELKIKYEESTYDSSYDNSGDNITLLYIIF